MKCEVCGVKISEDEKMSKNGKILCEDCYLDMVSKPKTCDPWAVYSAKNLAGKDNALTENQQTILNLLAKKGGCVSFDDALSCLDMTVQDLEREFAVLRHMEKVRGKLESGKKFICLW